MLLDRKTLACCLFTAAVVGSAMWTSANDPYSWWVALQHSHGHSEPVHKEPRVRVDPWPTASLDVRIDEELESPMRARYGGATDDEKLLLLSETGYGDWHEAIRLAATRSDDGDLVFDVVLGQWYYGYAFRLRVAHAANGLRVESSHAAYYSDLHLVNETADMYELRALAGELRLSSGDWSDGSTLGAAFDFSFRLPGSAEWIRARGAGRVTVMASKND